MRRLPAIAIAAVTVSVFAGSVQAQSLSDRIEHVRQQRQAQQTQQQEAQPRRVSMGQKLARPLGDASISDVPARQAFEWLEDLTDITFVINWERLEEAGIDASTPIEVPAGLNASGALDLMVAQMEDFEPLIWEPTPWYVQVMTKQQANQRTVLRIYPINDLLMEVPHFDNAPSFDLTEITSGNQGGGGAGGGGGGGGGQGIFDDQNQNQNQQDIGATRDERAMEIADLIRTSIEPDIWLANGGNVGSITYYQGSLIIRAPNYVHREIGIDQALRPTPRPTYRPAQVTAPGPAGAAGGAPAAGGYVEVNVRGGQTQANEQRSVPTQRVRPRGSRNAGILPRTGGNAGVR